MTLGVRTFTILGPLLCVAGTALGQVGHTEITKWPQGKRGAVSLTYDDGTVRVREGAFPRQGGDEASESTAQAVSWDDLAALARRGYELASHTVTHPRLAVLDEANLVYELEKSRQDILDHLGGRHTFSVECPYGTENDRVLEYALARYPLARNRMPDPFVEDLDRGSDESPSASTREYVRWQRGALTRTPMSLMKSWVDTAAAGDDVWLVLVFHGVDGVGWEPRTSGDLSEYFAYLKSKEDSLWIATFQDVARYIRERMHGAVRSYVRDDAISVLLRDDLTDERYDLPLTLETGVPPEWTAVDARQGGRAQRVPVVRDGERSYVLYAAIPNGEDVQLTPAAPQPR